MRANVVSMSPDAIQQHIILLQLRNPFAAPLRMKISRLFRQIIVQAIVNLIEKRAQSARMLVLDVDLCQYFGQKKLKYYADFFSSSSSLCCGVI